MTADGGVPAPAADVFAASRDHLVRTSSVMQRILGRNAYAVSGRGAEVTLSDGRQVVDFGSFAATLLGHRPPAVVAAVQHQLGLLPGAAKGLAHAPAPELARRLVELAGPSGLDRVWLGLNGSDVVEATLKLARKSTGRLRALAVRGGFHGRTLGALSLSDGDSYHADLDPLLGHVTYLDVAADAVERELARGDVAVLFFEVVQGAGPVVPLPAEVLRRWCGDARRAGVAIVADEIQTGLWRCGPFSMALDLGLDPDAVLFSKALGGGVMPLSAALCRSSLVAPLEQSPYLHSQTFSGHPLACAAGVAALEALPAAVEAHAARVGRELAAMLDGVAAHDEVVAAVHALGLMGSIEFRTAPLAQQFVIGAARDGLLLWPCDGAPTVVRVLPPLVATPAEADRAASILDRQCALAGSRTAHAV